MSFARYPRLIWQTRNQNITPTQIGACANIRRKHSPAARKINKSENQVRYRDVSELDAAAMFVNRSM